MTSNKSSAMACSLSPASHTGGVIFDVPLDFRVAESKPTKPSFVFTGGAAGHKNKTVRETVEGQQRRHATEVTRLLGVYSRRDKTRSKLFAVGATTKISIPLGVRRDRHHEGGR